MNIALSNALNGLQQQSARIAKAADNVLKQTSGIKDPDNDGDVDSLESSAVEIKEAGVDYKANAKVIKAQNEMLGSLLDIVA